MQGALVWRREALSGKQKASTFDARIQILCSLDGLMPVISRTYSNSILNQPQRSLRLSSVRLGSQICVPASFRMGDHTVEMVEANKQPPDSIDANLLAPSHNRLGPHLPRKAPPPYGHAAVHQHSAGSPHPLPRTNSTSLYLTLPHLTLVTPSSGRFRDTCTVRSA